MQEIYDFEFSESQLSMLKKKALRPLKRSVVLSLILTLVFGILSVIELFDGSLLLVPLPLILLFITSLMLSKHNSMWKKQLEVVRISRYRFAFEADSVQIDVSRNGEIVTAQKIYYKDLSAVALDQNFFQFNYLNSLYSIPAELLADDCIPKKVAADYLENHPVASKKQSLIYAVFFYLTVALLFTGVIITFTAGDENFMVMRALKFYLYTLPVPLAFFIYSWYLWRKKLLKVIAFVLNTIIFVIFFALAMLSGTNKDSVMFEERIYNIQSQTQVYIPEFETANFSFDRDYKNFSCRLNLHKDSAILFENLLKDGATDWQPLTYDLVTSSGVTLVSKAEFEYYFTYDITCNELNSPLHENRCNVVYAGYDVDSNYIELADVAI